MMIEAGDLAYLKNQIYSCGTAPDFRDTLTGHRLRRSKRSLLHLPIRGFRKPQPYQYLVVKVY
jgi:hypothetical protein